MLANKKGLVIGVANEQSIAYGCARQMARAGATLTLSYGHPKALPYVAPITREVTRFEPVFADLSRDEDIDRLLDQAATAMGGLDFLIHSVAFAPLEDLHHEVLQCSRSGFLTAMDISCYSLIACANRASQYLNNGGSLCAMSYYGAEKYVENYNLMGPVKAALEHTVRYLSHDLGPANLRINAISPGPIKTRAASGIHEFSNLLENAHARAPIKHDPNIDEVGSVAAFLCSDHAASITGEIIHVDSGYHVMG